MVCSEQTVRFSFFRSMHIKYRIDHLKQYIARVLVMPILRANRTGKAAKLEIYTGNHPIYIMIGLSSSGGSFF